MQLICLTKEVITLRRGKMNRPKKQICFTHIQVDEWSLKGNDRRKMSSVDTGEERSRRAEGGGGLGASFRL